MLCTIFRDILYFTFSFSLVKHRRSQMIKTKPNVKGSFKSPRVQDLMSQDLFIHVHVAICPNPTERQTFLFLSSVHFLSEFL